MKRSINLFSIVLIGLFSITILNNQAFAGNDQDNAEGPKFEYKAENNRIILDTMYLDAIEDVNLDIEFENTGNAPLILSAVRACCGTNVKYFPEEPIQPGNTGVIEIFFRVAPRAHNLSRTVVTVSNDPSGQKILRIAGRVEEKTE